MTELSLPFVFSGQAFLANGDELRFNVYEVTVLWNGQPRHVEADETGPTPLVGMLMLDGHTLTVDVEEGGRVLIEAKA